MPLPPLTHKVPTATTTRTKRKPNFSTSKQVWAIIMATAMMLSCVSKQRGSSLGLFTVRAWMLRPTTTTTTRFGGSRFFASSLAAAAGRPPALYEEDWQAAMGDRKMPPPVLESTDYNGYGALDYPPDESYDNMALDWINGPPMIDNGLYSDDWVSSDPVIPEELLTQAPIPDSDDDDNNNKNDPVVTAVKVASSPSPSSQSSSLPNAPRVAPTSTEAKQSISKPNKDKENNTKEKDSDSSISSQFQGLENILSEVTPSLPEPTQQLQRPSEPPSSHVHAAHAVVDDAMHKFLSNSAARGVTDDVDDLRDVQLPEITRQIFQQTNGQEFNINSPSQVSVALFGIKGKSTNKDTLSAMAGAGNRLADLILQYRNVAARIKKLQRRATHEAAGTHVSSVSTVARATVVAANTTTAPETVLEAADPLLLLDASGFIFRAYHSMPPIHRADGMPTGAVLGFCNMLNRLLLHRLLDGEQPRMILAFDSQGPSFRKDIYKEYKAHRPEVPMDLIPQFDLIRQASMAFGVPMVEAPAYEADDVIATLARQAHKQGLDVHILSADKDLMQLVTGPAEEPCIHMIDPMSMSRITYQQVVEKWGVGPELLGDVLALAGDSADNVPGVPGIGPKIAGTLLSEYGNLENLLANADKIKQKSRREKLIENIDMARLSRDLVELREDVDSVLSISGNMSEWRTDPLDTERLFAFYDEMGFKDLKRRLNNSLQRGTPRQRPKSRNGKEKVEVPNPEDFADVPF